MLIEPQTRRRIARTGLTAYDPERASPGYTLYAPMSGNGAVYLLDAAGQVAHQWQMPYPPGLYGYLLPNGNLFYGGKVRDDGAWDIFDGFQRFKGGIMLEADWDGNILWEHRDAYHHHDARRTPSGGCLYMTAERMDDAAAAQVQGGQPGSAAGGMWCDTLVEVDAAGRRIWEWRAADHLDPARHIITFNDLRDEWSHGNTIVPLPADSPTVIPAPAGIHRPTDSPTVIPAQAGIQPSTIDRVMFSFRNISTVGIIDRATDAIVWQLGDDILAQQHDPSLLDNGNILIYDNGSHRRNDPLPASRVIEVNPATNEIVWQYRDNPPFNFFSAYISGARRLPNGNTLITEGHFGRIFQVTPDGSVVWEYINPHFAPNEQGYPVNSVFRATHYLPDALPQLG